MASEEISSRNVQVSLGLGFRDQRDGTEYKGSNTAHLQLFQRNIRHYLSLKI